MFQLDRSRARRALFTLCLLSFACLAPSRASAADPPAAKKKVATQQRADAARDLKICRKIEKEPAGPACFASWLAVWRDLAAEADVKYAQQHATASPGATPAGGAPGTASTAGSASSVGAVAATSLGGDVLDLCALAPRADEKRFTRKRAIVFAPAGADALEGDAALKKVEAGALLRGVFAARFPLRRFWNVTTSLPAKAEWLDLPELSVADVRQHLDAAAPARPGDAPDASSDPARREALFVGYSAACADFLVVPAVASHVALHKPSTAKGPDGKDAPVDTVHLEVSGRLAVFARDGGTFRRVAAVTGSVPSLVDRISDTAAIAAGAAAGAVPSPAGLPGGVPGLGALADAAPSFTGPTKVPSYVSAVPGASCKLSQAPTDGSAGLASCAPQGQLSSLLVAGEFDERLGPVCRESASGKLAPDQAADALARCEVRVRAGQLARALQKQTRSVQGFRLYDALAAGTDEASPPHAMTLGKEEGVAVGHGFQAVDADGKRVAYFKVVRTGPGGEKGATERTHLRLRAGEADEGARLDEVPQSGIVIVPFGSAAALTSNWGTTTYHDAGGTGLVAFALPKAVVGAGLSVGFDLSGLLGSVETYVRASGAYLTGSGQNTQANVIPIELLIEKGFYAGKRLTLFVAAGGTFTMAKVQVKETDVTAARDYDAKTYGPAGHLGVDVLLTPSVSLRLEGVARVPVTKAAYSAADATSLTSGVVDADWARRVDRFATVGANAGLALTF